MILLASCQQPHKCEPSRRENAANEIIGKVARKLKKETELRPCGSGGQTSHGVEMLALSFDYYGSIDIKEARELLIIAVCEFVAAVNADEEIRPFLNNFPFTDKNVEIRIFVKNRDGSDVTMGKLRVVSAIDGVLDYDVKDPSEPLFKTIHRETYKEAISRVRG